MTRNHHLVEDDTAPTQCLPDAFPFSLKYGFFCTCLPLEEALTTVPQEPSPPVQQPPWYVRNFFGKRKTVAADANTPPNGTASVEQAMPSTTEAISNDSKIKRPELPFDNSLIVFVLGGPGVGKGTQCEQLVEMYGLVHISTGDLLREEVANDTELGQVIKHAMEEGTMVSNDVTVRLLLQAMESAGRNVPGFLIDGFPRTMDQAIQFENTIGSCNLVLYYECPADVLVDRLLKRGEASGRLDDNPRSIEKRIHVFEKTSLPVIEHYQVDGRVQQVNGNTSVEEVTERTFAIFDTLFGVSGTGTDVEVEEELENVNID